MEYKSHESRHSRYSGLQGYVGVVCSMCLLECTIEDSHIYIGAQRLLPMQMCPQVARI